MSKLETKKIFKRSETNLLAAPNDAVINEQKLADAEKEIKRKKLESLMLEKQKKLERMLALEQETQQRLLESYNLAVEKLPLPMDLLRRGLTDLGPCPENLRYVYRKLSLPMSGLGSIAELKNYPYIVNLELSGNAISDISILGHMKYLVEIDLSANKLSDNLTIDPPPHNLQLLDLSRNQITKVDDLTRHAYLSKLCLDRNRLQNISGLAACKHLTHLSAGMNGITSIEALHCLPLKVLDLRYNRLESLKGVEHMVMLEALNAQHNSVEDLTPLLNHQKINLLNLEENHVSQTEQVQILSTCPNLRNLRLARNPIGVLHASYWQPPENACLNSNARYLPSYRLKTVFTVPKVTVLDRVPVTPEEKVAAIDAYNPPSNVVISMQHLNHIKQTAKAYCRIKAEDLIRARRLRPIVLFGPNGSGKRTLTCRLLQQYPHLYGLSVSHTTRKPRPGEENGVHYHFVSKAEMQRMDEQGLFIQVVTLFGNMYGTSMDSVDKVTEEGKICIMDLEVEGVTALRKSHLKPRYILITTPTIEILQKRLNQRASDAAADEKLQSESLESMESPKASKLDDDQIGLWLQKAQNEFGELSKETADFTIVNDDIDRAYKELKNFCLGVYWKDFDQED